MARTDVNSLIGPRISLFPDALAQWNALPYAEKVDYQVQAQLILNSDALRYMKLDDFKTEVNLELNLEHYESSSESEYDSTNESTLYSSVSSVASSEDGGEVSDREGSLQGSLANERSQEYGRETQRHGISHPSTPSSSRTVRDFSTPQSTRSPYTSRYGTMSMAPPSRRSAYSTSSVASQGPSTRITHTVQPSNSMSSYSTRTTSALRTPVTLSNTTRHTYPYRLVSYAPYRQPVVGHRQTPRAGSSSSGTGDDTGSELDSDVEEHINQMALERNIRMSEYSDSELAVEDFSELKDYASGRQW